MAEKKKFEVGLCKRYWKYYTIEAETEAQARIAAFEQEEKDNLPHDIGNGWSDYHNVVEVSDINFIEKT